MRALLGLIAFTSVFAAAQAAPSPQTARQALIEMFFGTAPNHVEKHLPDATRNTLKNLDTAQGMSVLDQFTTIVTGAKMQGNIETFDTGATLLTAQNPDGSTKIEIGVERDDLMGDEDEIELSLRTFQQNKEQRLPFVPRLTFVMKSEGNVWRLNEINFGIKIPLADPDFLKGLVDQQRAQNEQMAIWSLHEVAYAETSYSKAQGSFACSLSALADATKTPDHRTYLYDRQLMEGKKRGYVYAISGCDANHYKVAAEPASPESGHRAFCSDESETVRASSDGKATTCLSGGEPVKDVFGRVRGVGGPPIEANSGSARGVEGVVGDMPLRAPTGGIGAPQRVRVSGGVLQRLRSSYVAPVYPQEAKIARVQGAVVLGAVIGRDGIVQSLRVISSASPMLDQAALDAVKQWKYRPYILNGNPIEVDTTITVNFVLAENPAAKQPVE